jgi:hypothetical protein
MIRVGAVYLLEETYFCFHLLAGAAQARVRGWLGGLFGPWSGDWNGGDRYIYSIFILYLGVVFIVFIQDST